jgi:hypothetical protein
MSLLLDRADVTLTQTIYGCTEYFSFLFPFIVHSAGEGGLKIWANSILFLTVFDQFINFPVYFFFRVGTAGQPTDWQREEPSSTSVQELCYKEYKLKISRNHLETDQTGDGCHCKTIASIRRPFCHAKRWIRGWKTALERKDRYRQLLPGNSSLVFTPSRGNEQDLLFQVGFMGGIRGYSLTTARTRSNVVH